MVHFMVYSGIRTLLVVSSIVASTARHRRLCSQALVPNAHGVLVNKVGIEKLLCLERLKDEVRERL
jgi:hypothetical protein